MNTITKNLLLGLTFVCVVVLIVFCIQLIVINRGVDPANQGPGISGGPPQGEDDPDGEEEDDPNGEDENGANGNTPLSPRPPPQGKRHEIRVAPESYLVIYAREELFGFEEQEIDWWFTYKGGGDATLEISYILITAQGVAAHAESLLKSYTGGSDVEVTGDGSIQGSELRGFHASTIHGGVIYEAWIHTLQGIDLALVFVINYENDQQRDALYEILSTLDMIGAGEAGQTTQTNGSSTDDHNDE